MMGRRVDTTGTWHIYVFHTYEEGKFHKSASATETLHTHIHSHDVTHASKLQRFK